MKNKYVFVAVMLIVILVASLGLTTISLQGSKKAENKDEITIVTSFYPMYIACLNVVGDAPGVNLQNLSEPQTGCLHDYQLTPMDMQLLSTADVFVINGGGIESFLADVAAAYPNLVIVEASEGLELLEGEEHDHDHDGAEEHEDHDEDSEDHDGHHHDEEGNAHAWMSIALYRQQVKTIAQAFCDYDTSRSNEYLQNAAEYDGKLAELQKKQDEIADELAGEHVILFHEAMAYTADGLGMEVAFTMDLDEERQVSAGEVATVVEEVEENRVRYIFAEEQYGKKMAETVERECQDVAVVYLNPLNRGEYDKDSYLQGMRDNLNAVQEAMKGN